MSRRSRDAPRPRRWPYALLLLAAAALGLLALRQGARLVGRLPPLRLTVLRTTDRLAAAQERVRRTADPALRDALSALYASRRLVEFELGRDGQPGSLVSELAAATSAATRSRLIRVHLALARLLAAQASRRPARETAAAVHACFDGIDEYGFLHGLALLVSACAREYAASSLDPAAAWALAEQTVGPWHGQFLQTLSARFSTLADTLTGDGDDATARAIRGDLRRVLRSFVLEPAPATLRMTAADLLARELTRTGSAELEAGLAADLLTWRGRYRAAVRDLPANVLSIRPEPVLARAEYEAALRRLTLCSWLGASMLTAVIAAVLLSWTAFTARGRTLRVRVVTGWGAVVAAVALLAGVLWCNAPPEALAEEFRRDFSSAAYWWRHPFIAASLTVLLLLGAGWLGGGRQRGAGRTAVIGATASAAAALLAAALLVASSRTAAAMSEFEQRTRAAQEAGIAAIAGADAERLLDRLRTWSAE